MLCQIELPSIGIFKNASRLKRHQSDSKAMMQTPKNIGSKAFLAFSHLISLKVLWSLLAHNHV